MSDFKIVVEYKTSPSSKKMTAEYEYMYEMMDKVYSVMNANPRAIITVKKDWSK